LRSEPREYWRRPDHTVTSADFKKEMWVKVDYKVAWSESIALSPDATILAVQHGSSLDVFRIPE